MTAWIYNSRAELLEHGHPIAATLCAGFEPEELNSSSSRTIRKTAHTSFYAPELAGVRSVVEKFFVDYFVFGKARSEGLPDSVTDHFSFENGHFVILTADRPIHDR